VPEVPNTYYQVASQFRDLRLSGTRLAAGAGSLRSSRVAVLPGRREARPHATALTATEEPGLCPAGPFRRLRGARLVDLAMSTPGPNRSSERVRTPGVQGGNSRSPAASPQRYSMGGHC